MLYLHSHAQCHREKRTGAFVQAHWGRLQIAWANASKDSSSFSSSSILPDHFGATFVDLHVHHTPRVNVGGQVDLWELRLGNTRKKDNQTLDVTSYHNKRKRWSLSSVIEDEQKVFLTKVKVITFSCFHAFDLWKSCDGATDAGSSTLTSHLSQKTREVPLTTNTVQTIGRLHFYIPAFAQQREKDKSQRELVRGGKLSYS